MGCLILLFLILAVVCGVADASVYRVGDSPGWTIIANVDYNKWASSNTFHVGDTLVFEYDPRFHNVLQVSRVGYHICNMTAPIATYSTGNDSIVIHKAGHLYYTCGFVGHCGAGQKVDIRVPKSKGSILSPSVDPKASVVDPLAPRPFNNSGGSSILFSCNVRVVVFVIWIGNLLAFLN